MKSPWVVIPTYNEKGNIGQMVRELFIQPIDNMPVLIVDDNSPDGTQEIVRGLQKTYPNLNLVVRTKKSGLGSAYIHGFTYALEHGADAIVQMDADFSHDPKDVVRLLHGLQNADLVIGSRYSHGISVINWPLRRLLISVFGNAYAGVITGMPYKDVTGGFKAWRAETLRSIDLASVRADGYGFQIEMNYRAWKSKKHIIEIPIIFTERREGQSKMSKAIIREALFLVWKLRLFG
ncbi:MAG: dolichyl-phosphate beta-D-mannosyltransferase [Candidatus Andersenbacteria bacterium RIFCSPHIGHO2_12_FULL_45_11b]|uniref:Dolichyl-phosphate beta-D-mannosyltransferase n=1 Tax=Candidatus Andersenbacteria bacterium RIFCSPHIGHO2_12_FULL_45_11b TaxID=1797282 RepID=A0A1G1XAD8_9BACT|nr:MAG: dolichyl-phosphate beta-D-mannosyltransferase [Candidatus Andersenbacteria bacterium RIFCSPHIGHO2_12_FULL_45_11b]